MTNKETTGLWKVASTTSTKIYFSEEYRAAFKDLIREVIREEFSPAITETGDDVVEFDSQVKAPSGKKGTNTIRNP